MKTLTGFLLAFALTASIAYSQNLLLNGNFNSPNSLSAPDNWSIWSYNGGYANHEELTTTLNQNGHNNTGIYDGSYQMTIGQNGTGGGAGVFQIVSATAGLAYDLTVDAGAQAWWLPTGQIRLFFLDSSNNQLGLTQINTTDSIQPSTYDVGVVYQHWSILDVVAPAGTTQAKVEFAGYGGGSTWFDNAVLTVVPEPSTLGLAACGAALLLSRHHRFRLHAVRV